MAKKEPLNRLFTELSRLDDVITSLNDVLKDVPPVTTQTNKFGATNEVVHPAVREYKAYVKTFGELIKTIEGIGRPAAAPMENEEKKGDPVLDFLGKKTNTLPTSDTL